MKAGRLNHSVQFINYTQSPDGYGGTTPTAVIIQTCYANVTPLKQDRTVQANQSLLVGGYQIIIRYRRDFEPLSVYDVKYRGLTLTISSIQQYEEDRRMWLIIAMIKK